VGRNDHKEMIDLLADGERGISGFVIDASNAARRHRELSTEARRRGLQVVLDPKTQPMATLGGHTRTLAGIPWGFETHHQHEDFDGEDGRTLCELIAEFAIEHEFTHVLGPTHLLQGPNDAWLRRDIVSMGHVRNALGRQGADKALIYPLALPMEVMRDPAQRRAIIAAISDAPMDALWLKVENFGSDASGDKTAAYVEASRDFQELGVPLIADHVGGLPGNGLLAFGSVRGIVHGVTLFEGFRASHWRRSTVDENGRTPATRVYLPQLDVLLDRGIAEQFLRVSTRVRSQFACRDTSCCPRGLQDMLGRPARHYVHQRSREIRQLSEVPPSLRASFYVEEFVRRVSDSVAAVASLSGIDTQLLERFGRKQRTLSRFRTAMAHLADAMSRDAQDGGREAQP
jgi:hypothetical protein